MIAGTESFFSWLYEELDEHYNEPDERGMTDEEYKVYLRDLIKRIFKILKDDEWH